MTLPVAGWYDDPADAEQLRWWTGHAWSEAREPRVAVAPAIPGAPAIPLPYGPTAGAGPASVAAVEHSAEPTTLALVRRANPLAFTGLFVGLLAVVFNPLSGPGLLTLLLGVLGLVRANELKRGGATTTGLLWAIAALVLGGIAAARLVIDLAVMGR